MVDITFIIPVGRGHEDLAQRRAIPSIEAQSIFCQYIMIYDQHGSGPAWARNEGLKQIRTRFVSFLDADDWIEPMWAEKMRAAWKPGKYVYSNWYRGGDVVRAPEKVWCKGTWHVITSLIPTVYALETGFDEDLPGAEDTAFYMALTKAGHCGVHVHEPLFHYGAEGLRAATFVSSEQFRPTMEVIQSRYGGNMGCCGDNVKVEQPPAGESFEGAILAQAIWGGNQQRLGGMTGRLYPRAGNGRVMWVHEADVNARPDLWRRVEVPEPEPPLPPSIKERQQDIPHGVGEIARRLYAAAAPVESVMIATTPAQAKPDIDRILKLYRQAND